MSTEARVEWKLGKGQGHGSGIELRRAEEAVYCQNQVDGQGTHWVALKSLQLEAQVFSDGFDDNIVL